MRKNCLRGPQEPVSHIDRVNIVSGDRIDRIVGKRDGALEGACPRARNIESDDGRRRPKEGRVAEILHAIDRATGSTGRRGARGGIGRPRRLRQRKTGEENGNKKENSR